MKAIYFKINYLGTIQIGMYYIGKKGSENFRFLQLREYWKDVEYRLHHRLTKFDWSVFLNLKPISYFLAFIWLGFFYLESIGVRYIMI